MTHVHDPRATLTAQLREFSETLGGLEAAAADQQMTEHVRALISDLRHFVKACERESTKMAKIFEQEIRELRLANEMLRARSALHEADQSLVHSKTMIVNVTGFRHTCGVRCRGAPLTAADLKKSRNKRLCVP